MKKKVLFWQTSDFFNYNLAYELQNKNLDLYVIIDLPNKPKKFFQNQNFVNYTKKWFFHDHIKKDFIYEEEYLKEFENKYGINLWLLAYNERIFFNYNKYKQFGENEVLSILYQECLFFEKILDEVSPEFLIIPITWQHQSELLRLMCKKRDIRILMINGFVFGASSNKWIISENLDTIDKVIETKSKTTDGSFIKLEEVLKGFSINTNTINLSYRQNKNSKILRLKSMIEMLSSDNNKTHFTYFGRSSLKVIKNEIILLIKKKYREYYIEKNLEKKIPELKKLILFPLHTEEERATLIGAPYYTNQIEIIKNITKALPIGYQLIVKEHPSMRIRGWRKISDYKEMMKLPNVVVLHPNTDIVDIIKKSKLVITINSTTGFEAAFYEKPSITFMKKHYSNLSFTKVNYNFNELPMDIRKMLKTKVEPNELFDYLDSFKEELIDFNYTKFQIDYGNTFYYGGNIVDIDINYNIMKEFLEINRDNFLILADKYYKKISGV